MPGVQIVNSPSSTLLSANNDAIWVVSGSAGYTSSVHDFKFLADIFVSGSLVTTLKRFPDTAYPNMGVFNLKSVAANLVAFDFLGDTSNTDIFHSASNSFVDVTIQFGREYIFNNVFTQSRNEVSTSDYYFLNSSLPFTQQGQGLSNNRITNAGTGSFLQSKHDSLTTPFKTYNNLRRWAYYFADTNAASYLNVRTYDSNLNLLQRYAFANPYSSSSNSSQFVSIGIPQLSSYVNFTGVSYYDIGLGSSGSFDRSEVLRFQILTDCSRYASGAYKVYWLNSYGGFDSWLFNKKGQVTTSKNQSSFKQIPGKLNSSGTYNINTYSRVNIPYFTELSDKLELSTDFLTDNEVIYLKDLYSSPVVYLEDPNGVIFSATVDTSDYVLNKKVNTKVYSLQLTFLTSYNDYRQQL
jgi:hypothetical protein